MKSSTKILGIIAASTLVASLPAVLAQDAPPPPPPPPPPTAAPMNPGASGRGTGRGTGAGGPGRGTANFPAYNGPTAEEYATLNKALKDILSKDPAAAKVYEAHPDWAGPLLGGGGNRGNNGGTGRGRGGAGAGG